MSARENRKATIYCDESGHSGPNYLDHNQPFYVLASMVVPYDRTADVAAQIEHHRQKYSPQSEELKASSLVKTNNGKRGLISLIKSLGKLGCVPLYELLEKRYCVAAKLIETFLDPAFNARVSNAFIPDSTTKQEIANTLYEKLPEETLNRFAAIYRNPNCGEFESSLNEIVSTVRINVSPELANLIDGSRPNIREIAEIKASVSFLGKLSETLNFPVFVGMLMMIEVLGRLELIDPVKFVHDEIYAYQESFEKLFEKLRNANEGVFVYPNGHIVVFPLRHVPKIEFGSSQGSHIIQAADALASSVNYLAKRAIQSRSINEVDVELASLLFPALLNDIPRIAWSVGSDRWVKALGSYYMAPLCEGAPTTKPRKVSFQQDWFEPAPLLPVTGNQSSQDDRKPKRDFPVPIYGLIGKRSGYLMSINVVDIPEIPGEAAVVLFSSRQNAETFLQKWGEGVELDEEQEIFCFGPRQILMLTGHLDSIQQCSRTIVFDWGTKDMALTSLNDVVFQLKRLLDRVQRAIASGIFRQLFQIHDVQGMRIMSYLASDGSYLAGIYPDGKMYRAKSRDEAVKAVVRAEQNIESAE